MRKCVLALLIGLLCAASKEEGIEEIERNIHLNTNKLQEATAQKTKLSNHLNTLGNAINQKYKQSQELARQIRDIQKNIDKNQAQNQAQEKTLGEYRTYLNSLKKNRLKIQDEVTTLLLKDIVFVMVLESQDLVSTEDLMLQELFKRLSQSSKNRLENLSIQEEQVNAKIAKISDSIAKISATIDVQKDRKHDLQLIVEAQQKLIESMRAELQVYNKKLETLDKERRGLDQLLASLNIVKLAKQKEMENKKASNNEEGSKSALGGIEAPIEVRQVASSYRDIVTIAYHGPKTISPLSSYKIVQKFGPYFDPVYRLKVFNESITLVPTRPNAVVRSVFDGRVVYAKEVPILKKVIIIEHKDGMHTIYSQLDKIAPTIKHGLHVQKGYVIGRIDQRLSFEVTLKDKHINPLELIAQNP
ncbi:murein hydrolase activator EnvC family protein [Helicobacter felis]|uniref:Metallopeptidase n=1 Tax=Helicobacter felis (strain ATCC 49179 / CCUG 28539 / NCTC 12436 / CS1) TaxID=936155 RepID=E7ADC1_HELFC|nr:peptidoglycan DD-metalloendopeptidase family protein [Helicobacter felis]CBY83178.1 putative metallopeptidase [Helicobacter felis ATCC 49179]